MDHRPTLTRRHLLAGAATLAILPGTALAAPPAPAPLSFHLVDGWVLTNHDLAALGLHAD